MRELPVLRELPRDVRVVRGSRGLLAADPRCLERLLRAGLGPDDAPRLKASDRVGKRALEELDGEAGRVDERLLVRRFHHGGLLRWFSRDRFLDPERPFVEWTLQRELGRLGFLSPAVVAARAVRAFPIGWNLLLVTRRVEDALDVGELLALRARDQIDGRAWRNVLRALGHLLARLHAAGFLHADLTPRNLLVERRALRAAEPYLWLLDLDRSRFLRPLVRSERLANLRRLERHVERQESERSWRVSRVDRMRMLAAYEPERGARRVLVQELLRLRSDRRRHLPGWILERWLGRGRRGTERHLDARD